MSVEKEVEEEIKENDDNNPEYHRPVCPVGKDDSENVEIQRYGEPVVPDFEIPYHTELWRS